MTDPNQQNAQDLEQELLWFAQVLDTRFKRYFGQESIHQTVFEVVRPDLTDSPSPYAQFVKQYQLSFADRFLLILALVPHIRPRLLDVFYTKNKQFDRKFTEFGGIREGTNGDFFPTVETFIFILAGQDLELRFSLQAIFDRDHFFNKHHIFDWPTAEQKTTLLKLPLRLTEEYLSLFTTVKIQSPHFNNQFPAQLLTTDLDWEDLILNSESLAAIREIENWMNHGQTLMNDWQMSGKISPGYKVLFYGPPGTGKKLAVKLLGKYTKHDVYRIDLSLVVSKYIGETAKNLAHVFDIVAQKKWILFFDEADMLFGERDKTNDSNNRYANQEVAYLLQHIESFNGIVILASNVKLNIDEAFVRRFQSVIYFPMPSTEERLQIWQKGFSPKTTLASNVNIQEIAEEFTISGGAIMNVIRYASLESLRNNSNVITLKSLMQGIRQELAKEGKIL